MTRDQGIPLRRIPLHSHRRRPTARLRLDPESAGPVLHRRELHRFQPSASLQRVGSRVSNDGADYTLYVNYSPPAIEGEPVVPQYWAIRSSKRTSGIINMRTFWAGWQSAGLTLGVNAGLVFAVQAVDGSGEADVAVNVSDRPPAT